ncbi:hypothetical protein CDD82_616 [Ophiocordyceps australis]|uniref:Uncharacterized protein n=1 Tax=Ophiocordyceps australis TaxID=1399860 RepID=A0A2C5YM34_9HYPO|nr:hypothetical protein CDD82_616 [Ophiocordyceps australis]
MVKKRNLGGFAGPLDSTSTLTRHRVGRAGAPISNSLIIALIGISSGYGFLDGLLEPSWRPCLDSFYGCLSIATKCSGLDVASTSRIRGGRCTGVDSCAAVIAVRHPTTTEFDSLFQPYILSTVYTGALYWGSGSWILGFQHQWKQSRRPLPSKGRGRRPDHTATNPEKQRHGLLDIAGGNASSESVNDCPESHGSDP